MMPLIEKDEVFQGVVAWNEIMKMKPEQRSELRVEQLPTKQISIFSGESILEAHKIIAREKLDLIPVVERQAASKRLWVL